MANELNTLTALKLSTYRLQIFLVKCECLRSLQLHMSHFIMNLNQHHKTLLLLGCLALPFDTSTMTAIARFIAVAIGKIYKIRAEKLRELEAPWLSK